MINRIEIDGIQVDLVFKKIKNVNLQILSPDGTVRVSAPKRTPLKHIRILVLSQLDWIKRHQASSTLRRGRGDIGGLIEAKICLRWKYTPTKISRRKSWKLALEVGNRVGKKKGLQAMMLATP